MLAQPDMPAARARRLLSGPPALGLRCARRLGGAHRYLVVVRPDATLIGERPHATSGVRSSAPPYQTMAGELCRGFHLGLDFLVDRGIMLCFGDRVQQRRMQVVGALRHFSAGEPTHASACASSGALRAIEVSNAVANTETCVSGSCDATDCSTASVGLVGAVGFAAAFISRRISCSWSITLLNAATRCSSRGSLASSASSCTSGGATEMRSSLGAHQRYPLFDTRVAPLVSSMPSPPTHPQRGNTTRRSRSRN
jgi:hypothetical protein